MTWLDDESCTNVNYLLGTFLCFSQIKYLQSSQRVLNKGSKWIVLVYLFLVAYSVFEGVEHESEIIQQKRNTPKLSTSKYHLTGLLIVKIFFNFYRLRK